MEIQFKGVQKKADYVVAAELDSGQWLIQSSETGKYKIISPEVFGRDFVECGKESEDNEPF